MRILLTLLLIALPPLLGRGGGGEVVAQSKLPKAVNDSLWAVWNNPKEADTNRLDAIHRIAYSGYRGSNADSAIWYAQLEFDFAKQRGLKKSMAWALNTQGVANFEKGNLSEALELHRQSLQLREEIDDKRGKASTYGNIGLVYQTMGDYPKAIEYTARCLNIMEQLGNKHGIAASLNNLSTNYRHIGDHAKAIDHIERSLKIREQIANRNGVADGLINIGIIHRGQGDHVKAIAYYSRGLKVYEELQDLNGVTVALTNIGIVHYDQEDYDKAIEYFEMSLRISEQLKDKYALANTLNSMGQCYSKKGNIGKAVECYEQCLRIQEELNDSQGIAATLVNLGIIFNQKKEYMKSLDYCSKGLDLMEQINYQEGISMASINMGATYFDMNEYSKAVHYGSKSLLIAKALGVTKETRDAAELLFNAYKALNRPDSALLMHELYIQMRDSIASEENQKEVMRQQFQYDYEKKELAIQKEMELSALKHEYEKKQAAARTEKEKQQLRYEEELKRTQIEADYAQRQAAMEAEQKRKDALAKAEQDKKDAIATEQLRRKNQQRNAFIGGFALTLGLAGVSYRSYRRKKRDNTIITSQKEVVEKKNHAILESITYARKLQEAVLPPAKVVKEFFADSFLLYLPRDIVSGDFYWMESKDGISLFALGDCTGHGVPGAMLSVMGLNGLNRALNELHITQPADFLTQLTKDLHDAFQRSDSMVRDGMDLSICALDSTNRKLTYAGANNPLWIARNGEIIVHKPNKRPVGHHDMEGEGFSQITIDLQEGDTIYLMTDGYADQLGGPTPEASGLKMMTKAFRERLASLSSLPLPQQREQLIADLDAWKGNGHQTDDVCVMGVRIS